MITTISFLEHLTFHKWPKKQKNAKALAAHPHIALPLAVAGTLPGPEATQGLRQALAGLGIEGHAWRSRLTVQVESQVTDGFCMVDISDFRNTQGGFRRF